MPACTSNEPNHIGNPILLPINGVSTGLENLNYSARRSRVSAHIESRFEQLQLEANSEPADAFFRLYKLARVPKQHQIKFYNEVKNNTALYFGNDKEPLVVAAMVHGR